MSFSRAWNEIRRGAHGAVNKIAHTVFGLSTSTDPVRYGTQNRIQPDALQAGFYPVLTMSTGRIKIACPPSNGEQSTLLSVDGDSETKVVAGATYTARCRPPISPKTNKEAQPGEYLLMTGYPVIPIITEQDETGRDVDRQDNQGKRNDAAIWLHITDKLYALGADKIEFDLSEDTVSFTLDKSTFTMKSGEFETKVSKWHFEGDKFQVKADVEVDGDVSIEGDTTMTGDLKIKGDLSVTGKVEVTGSLVINGLDFMFHTHSNGNLGSPTGGVIG